MNTDEIEARESAVQRCGSGESLPEIPVNPIKGGARLETHNEVHGEVANCASCQNEEQRRDGEFDIPAKNLPKRDVGVDDAPASAGLGNGREFHGAPVSHATAESGIHARSSHGYFVVNGNQLYYKRAASLITGGRWVMLPQDATEFVNYETALVVAEQYKDTSIPAWVVSAAPPQQELPL